MSDPTPPPYNDVPFTEVPQTEPVIPPASGAGYTPPPPPSSSGGGGLSQNSAAALSYVTIIPAIIFLILEPYNKMPLVRFHAIQSLLLAAAWTVVWIVVAIMHPVMSFVPLSWILFMLLDLAVSLGFFVMWLLAIIKASRGEWYKLPFIGDHADRMARS